MNIIVTEIREGIAYYPDLAEWVRSFDHDPDDPNYDALALMEGDPDKIRWNGYYMYFIDTELNGTKYVLTSEEVDEKSKEMLIKFHCPDRELFYERQESDWDVFSSLSEAIAYRGGKGYSYNIWKYNPKTQIQS